MANDPNVHPEWASHAKEVASKLGEYDYFQILGCEQTANVSFIKQCYHTLQREYHPDAFYSSPDVELKNAVLLISKRVSEAYAILRDPEKRVKYSADINGPDRELKLRYSEASAQELKKAKVELTGKTPQVRQLVDKASQSIKIGDFAAAKRDLKMALLFEGDNEFIKAQLAEVDRKLGDAT